MSDAEVEAKFRGLARKALQSEQSDRLLKALWKTEEMSDAGEIVRLTVASHGSSAGRPL